MIDRLFLRSVEGFSLAGYVPMQDGEVVGHSGVTVATGVDIGQHSPAEIDALTIPADLKAALKPYAGLTGVFAARVIASEPLSLSLDEADALDAAVQGPRLARLRDAYNAVVLPVDLPGFDDIPSAAQTVLFSVAWQYGDLPSKCPNFWRKCATQHWPAVVDELEHFGDSFPTRRGKEAAYLKNALSA